MKNETWYEAVFGMLTCLCPQSADGLNFESEPQWVLNVWKQLVQQVMPAVSLKPQEVTPRRLGRLLGQEEANWTAIANTCAKNDTPENRAREEATFKQLEVHRDNPAVAGVLEAAQFAENCLKASVPLIRLRISITIDAMLAAWQQPDERERVAFFQGIVEGLSKPGFPSRFTDATPIYQRLLVHRKEVAELKSVRELREFLLARGLTAQSLGEPKRLEKLCQRIGLSFSEPGRRQRKLHSSCGGRGGHKWPIYLPCCEGQRTRRGCRRWRYFFAWRGLPVVERREGMARILEQVRNTRNFNAVGFRVIKVRGGREKRLRPHFGCLLCQLL